MPTTQDTTLRTPNTKIVSFAKGEIVKVKDVVYFDHSSCTNNTWKTQYVTKEKKTAVVVRIWYGPSSSLRFESPDSPFRKKFTEVCSQNVVYMKVLTCLQGLTDVLNISNKLRHQNLVPYYGLTTHVHSLPALVRPYYSVTLMEYLKQKPQTIIIALVRIICALIVIIP